MDRTDISLSLFLMANSRTSYHDLAAQLGLSINAVHKRIKDMTDRGIISAFRARPSVSYLRAVPVWVFGRSDADHNQDLHLRLRRNDSTYWVASSGGGYVYVGGYLRDIGELEQYVAFVKEEAKVGEPTVAILTHPPSRFPHEELRPLDYQIISALHNDSRKSATEVASEVKASAKTVHRRLERMIETGLVEFSIDWYPDKSNDILGLCHATLSRSADRPKVSADLNKNLHQNTIFEIHFSNIPNQIALFLWTNSMKQMEDLREGVAKVDGISSVALNVLQTGHMFDTWRDDKILRNDLVAAAPSR